MKPAIKIKLSRIEVAELDKMYSYYLSRFASMAAGDHRALLLEHMSAMYHRVHGYMRHMLEEQQKKCSLKFTPVECLAFYQLWQLIDTSPFIAGNMIICRIIEQIDKASKAPRKSQPKILEP